MNVEKRHIIKTDNLPQRKHPRLKGYDYSENGYYFITICTDNMKCYFGSVGRGLAPAASNEEYAKVFEIFKVKLSVYGKIADTQIEQLVFRYPFICIENYVIMPNHIHILLSLNEKSAGACPRPTIMDIICSFKSITTRLCNQVSNISGRKIFQTSFYEKIIRNEKSLQNAWQYIDENPRKWKNDQYYK